MGVKDFQRPTIIEHLVTHRSARLRCPHHQEIHISALPEQLAQVRASPEAALVWTSHWNHVLDFAS